MKNTTLTKRELFAAMAMQAMIENGKHRTRTARAVQEDAAVICEQAVIFGNVLTRALKRTKNQ